MKRWVALLAVAILGAGIALQLRTDPPTPEVAKQRVLAAVPEVETPADTPFDWPTSEQAWWAALSKPDHPAAEWLFTRCEHLEGRERLDCHLLDMKQHDGFVGRWATNEAKIMAYKVGDKELARDLEFAHGYRHRTERTPERHVAQMWGRQFALWAPGVQEKVVKAAVLVTPDSMLHEPLSWIGGYPACRIKYDIVVCLP